MTYMATVLLGTAIMTLGPRREAQTQRSQCFLFRVGLKPLSPNSPWSTQISPKTHLVLRCCSFRRRASHSRSREYEPVAVQGWDEKRAEAERQQNSRRLLVSFVFMTIFATSMVAAVWSLSTDRLSKRYGSLIWMSDLFENRSFHQEHILRFCIGHRFLFLPCLGFVRLDWELYYMLFLLNCLWLELQAIMAATRAAQMDRAFAATAFFEGTISATWPVIADTYDTLKDVLVGALCVHSDSMVLKVLGISSWVYLAAIHFVFLGWFPRVKEMVGEEYCPEGAAGAGGLKIGWATSCPRAWPASPRCWAAMRPWCVPWP